MNQPARDSAKDPAERASQASTFPPPCLKPPGPIWLMTMRVLALIALGVSSYLFYASTQATAVAGCGAGSGCSIVLASQWASVWGVPVSLPAILVYAGVLLASFLVESQHGDNRRRAGWASLLLLGTLAGAAAVWFIIVQYAFIDALCPYCMVVHVSGLLLAGLVWMTVPLDTRGAEAMAEEANQVSGSQVVASTRLRPMLLAQCLAIALVLVAGFIAVQWTQRPPATHVTFQFHGHDIPLNIFPLLGEATAPHPMIFYFDYACPHCRVMHKYLYRIREAYPDQVVIALAPAPLSEKCNHQYGQPDARYEHSCEYAKLALIVWGAQPTQFEAFDRYLAEGDAPPPIEDARARAAEIVGQAVLDRELDSPALEQYVQSRIGDNMRLRDGQPEHGRGVPTLIYGPRNLMIGRPASYEDFLQTLHDDLTLGHRAD